MRNHSCRTVLCTFYSNTVIALWLVFVLMLIFSAFYTTEHFASVFSRSNNFMPLHDQAFSAPQDQKFAEPISYTSAMPWTNDQRAVCLMIGS